MSQPSTFSLNDYTDNNEQLLKAMGFDNEKEIKQALCMSNNDINEAVAILTNEKLPKITTLANNSNNDIENDIDMIDANTSQNDKKNQSMNDPLKFPYDALIQLENNVFTDNWSIPYKKDEWLERLLVSTIALLKEGLAELDPSCKKFLDRVLPEVYKKLLDSIPVKNWGNEIQQGVYNMTILALELIAIRTSQEGVPEFLLSTLALIFNPETTFHYKNIHKTWDRSYMDSIESVDALYSRDLETNGWLLDFINIFGINKGFDGIKNQLEKSNDLNEFNMLLKPLASCSSYLNENLLNYFENSIRRIYEFIKLLADDDFKDKNVGRVFDLIQTIKKLCANLWPTVVEEFNALHLTTVFNMLKYSHYNSKMNSLKEICKLIENVNSSMNASKLMINEDKLSEWIITEKVLSFAVEGNIDQSQYCEKIKTIVEFIGDRIKSEEISALWEMQYNKSMSIIDNLYTIIGIAATRFSPEQLDYLLVQIIQTWNNSSFKLHDKLVGLLRIIGREAKSNKTCSRILEALWELRNRPGLNRQLLFLIYTEHLNVLSGGRLPREAAKREYLKKCCDDIKKAPGSSIAIASLKHMYEILNSYQKNSNKALKDALTELVVPIMKNLCLSLLKCHSNAYEKAKLSNLKFDQTALIDDLFTHEEVVQTHLNSMKFILQEGNLYLNLNRAQDIWNTLITNEHSCDWDKKTGFEWFIDCWPDLSDDSRAEIFKKQILNLKPSKLSLKGYECFKLYFIRVNEHESRIQIKNDIDNFIVDKLDLIGLNFLWDIILYVDDESIADLATKFLLEISFEKVSAKIKRELVTLHQRFIKECYSRLENCLITLDSSPIGQLLLNAFKISYLAVALTEMENLPIASRSETLKCIERLLMIAERYIVKVEENQSIQRTNLPHFLTFKSESFSLAVFCDSTKQTVDLCVCSNETLGDLRAKIANYLNIQSNNLQIYYNDKLLNVLHDQKLLSQLNIDGMCNLVIKTATTYPSSLNQTPVKDTCLNFSARQDPELEKSFPGVLIANSNNGSAFEMLYRLEDLGEPKINNRVRNILKLIPTNPKLLESYDCIVGKSNTSSVNLINSSSLTATASASASASTDLVKSPSVSTLNSLASGILSQKQLSSQSTPSTPTFSSGIIPPQSSFSYVTNSVNAVTSMFMKRNDSSNSLDSRCSSNLTIASSKDYNKFFDKSLPLHRILYHLEALSSKLMPTSNDLNAQQNCDLFQQEFLKANGLETLISMLKLENFNSKTNEYETKQDIYILLLQLLRLIFFGSYYPMDQALQSNNEYNGVNKRPSTEPITTCAKKTILPSMIDCQNINQLSNLKNANSGLDSNFLFNGNDNKIQNLVEKMSLNEINEILIQLLIISWAAASGNLQFAYLNSNLINMIENKSPRTVSNSSASSQQNGVIKNGAFAKTPAVLLQSQSSKSINEETIRSDLDEDKSDFFITEPEAIAKTVQKEVKFFIQDHRLSTGSNMSTSSIDSSDNQSQNSQQQNFSPIINTGLLQSGICIKQKSISNKDVKIALKALEMFSCFLHYRKDCVSSLLELKLFSECVIDILTGSISSKIREYMEKFLLKLCQIEFQSLRCKDYLINLIIKSRLPLWGNSSITRTSTQRLISQSTQYFSLRSKLFRNMTFEEQTTYSIDLKKMLNDQLTWFLIFSPTKNLKTIDNILLAGHLSLTKSLLTCETAKKAEFGTKIIPLLVKTYLFPAAFLISNPSEDNSMDPICSDESTRIAAYKLLVELSRNCYPNYQLASKQLINLHHSHNPSTMSNDWNYIPLVTPRADCGYVGLKNGGATCYMNAILQQLYMMPGVPEYLLSIDNDDQEKNSVFYQLQNVFAHLKESKLEYHIPETFWKAFRMWGQEVNIREQQDAYDFFISMTDQIDEYLKKMNKEPIFKNILEGTFSNQFICTDCPHKYEREEAFLGLNLPIKSGNLEESLLQFVKDELLDGENSYNCEKCNEKRSAIKRTCIKKLPKYLCIQLKRFDYDWESNRSLKFDDYFQFPRLLDVSPYMYESINKTRQSFSNLEKPNSTSLTDLDEPLSTVNQMDTNSTSVLSQSLPNHSFQHKKRMPHKKEPKEVLYELVGIVVHSGQANAGHYYSFIKGFKDNHLNIQQELEELEERDRLIEEEENTNSMTEEPTVKQDRYNFLDLKNDKWFKFNDTSVEEINLNETTLIEECFGGTFTQSSEFKMLPEERVRYWNGYMLFYREVSYNGLFQQDILRTANNKLKQQRKETFSSKSKVSGDSLSELAELVSRGDEKGLFRTCLPPSIEQIVKSENLEFCKNRTIYDNDYFQFIYELVKISKDLCDEPTKAIDQDHFIANSCNLGLEFLYNTFFKTGKKLRIDLNKWLDLFKELMTLSKEAASTMLNFVVDHEANSNFIRHYLLECPINEIRDACAQLFDYFFNNLIIKFQFQPLNNPKINSLISSFVQLLDKAVIDLCKNSHEYFKVLFNYADLSKETTQQLISMSLFSKLLCFLLGNPGTVKIEESSNRRWNTIQSREFAIVHELIAILVLKCNVFSLKTCEPQDEQTDTKDLDITDQLVRKSFIYQLPLNKEDLIQLPQEMQIYLIGALSNRYLKELVYAFEQITPSLLPKTLEMILTCCYCNDLFSGNIIHQILLHVNNSSFNEIKQVLSLLNNIILIEDPLQLKRLQLAIDGYKDNDVIYNGLLSVVRQNQGSDAKKSYQCVKFIVALANTNGSCKDYLLKTAHNWEWSVNWLKKKMLDSNFNNWTTSKSNEDSESKTFQRTKSAQRTLDDATALLKGSENE